MRLKELERK